MASATDESKYAKASRAITGLHAPGAGLIVLVIAGILVAVAISRVDFSRFKADSVVQTIRATLAKAQRDAVTRGHNVIVTFDTAGQRIEVVWDANNNGLADAASASCGYRSSSETISWSPRPASTARSPRRSWGAHCTPSIRCRASRFGATGRSSTDLEVYVATTGRQGIARSTAPSPCTRLLARRRGIAATIRTPTGYRPPYDTRISARIRSTPRVRGMSLMEVIVALALLGSVMLGMEMFSARLSQSIYMARIKSTATQLANDRMEVVKGAPRYAAIESMYVATEATIAGFPGYTRQTLSEHIGGGATDTTDYRIITVIVTYPKQTSPLRKTTVIAPF